MDAISDIDRQAAEELRVVLAELSGFWHLPGDAGPLCAALARHRAQAERRLLESLAPATANASARSPEKEAPGAGIPGRLAFQGYPKDRGSTFERRPLPTRFT